MRRSSALTATLEDVSKRLGELEHAAEMIKTVLMVKEPDTIHAAGAYEGLRRQIVAATGERRSHLSQLTAIAVAVSRATDVADLRPQVNEWLHQASIVEVRDIPEGHRAHELFESTDGSTIEGVTDLDVLEPAYVDSVTGVVLRLGRARAAETDSASADSGED